MRPIIGSIDSHRTTTTTTTSGGTTTSTTTLFGALPALEGFGSQAGGASTPTVVHVTNLNASGAGSLHNAIVDTNPTGKTIVFDVGGTIHARHNMSVGNNFTIDGTTAPYPGITITSSVDDGMTIESANMHHIIVKGLAFVGCVNDGLGVNDGAHDIAVMHCIAYGNGDGNIDFSSDSLNCTMQYCIIGNHDQSVNPSNQGTGGTLVTAHFTTIHHNLFFPKSPNPDEGERFPFVHRNYGVASTPDCDIRNNLVWQYGRGNATGSGYGSYAGYGAKANIVSNYYKTTSAAAAPDGVCIDCDGSDSIHGSVYSNGNVSGNGFNFNIAPLNNHAEFAIAAQYQVTLDTACAAALKILQYAGPTQRNPIGGLRPPTHQSYIDGVTLPLTGC